MAMSERNESREPMSIYEELEEEWLSGRMSHAEASAIAEECGYGEGDQ